MKNRNVGRLDSYPYFLPAFNLASFSPVVFPMYGAENLWHWKQEYIVEEWTVQRNKENVILPIIPENCVLQHCTQRRWVNHKRGKPKAFRLALWCRPLGFQSECLHPVFKTGLSLACSVFHSTPCNVPGSSGGSPKSMSSWLLHGTGFLDPAFGLVQPWHSH